MLSYVLYCFTLLLFKFEMSRSKMRQLLLPQNKQSSNRKVWEGPTFLLSQRDSCYSEVKMYIFYYRGQYVVIESLCKGNENSESERDT